MAFTSSLSVCSLWQQHWPHCPLQRSAPGSTTYCWPSCSFTTEYVAWARPPRGPVRRCCSRGSYRGHKLLFPGDGGTLGGTEALQSRRPWARAAGSGGERSAPGGPGRSSFQSAGLSALGHQSPPENSRSACLSSSRRRERLHAGAAAGQGSHSFSVCPIFNCEERLFLRGGVLHGPRHGGVRGSADSVVPVHVLFTP